MLFDTQMYSLCLLKLLLRERERERINIKEYTGNEYLLVNTLVLLYCRLFFLEVF